MCAWRSWIFFTRPKILLSSSACPMHSQHQLSLRRMSSRSLSGNWSFRFFLRFLCNVCEIRYKKKRKGGGTNRDDNSNANLSLNFPTTASTYANETKHGRHGRHLRMWRERSCGGCKSFHGQLFFFIVQIFIWLNNMIFFI